MSPGNRETRAFYQRDLPSEAECKAWIADRRYTNARLRILWDRMGCEEAFQWMDWARKEYGTTPHTMRWIWKLAEERFPPEEKQVEDRAYAQAVRDKLDEKLFEPDPDQIPRIRVKQPEQRLTIAEQMMWVNDHLYCERTEITAPCRGAAAMWEQYHPDDKRDKFYTLLAQKVIPKQQAEDEARERRRLEKEKAELEAKMEKERLKEQRQAAKQQQQQEKRDEQRKKKEIPDSDLKKDLDRMIDWATKRAAGQR